VLYRVMKPLAFVALRILCRAEGRGMEHVPATGALLLVANHSSFLDPPLVGSIAPRELTFLAKADLFRIPLFGALIHGLNARPLRREGSDPAALRAALGILREGRALLIFPEGTRGDEGTLRPAKAGAGMLAVLSGAAVVPVYICGSGRVWPRERRVPRPGKVVVTFGPAMRFPRRDDVDRKAQYDAASRAMMDAIGGLRGGSSAAGASTRARSDADLLQVAGGAGGRARRPPKYNDGRNGQDG
jgi:1-acyl-sn-glycerol-3-phosphate acyltransferase